MKKVSELKTLGLFVVFVLALFFVGSLVLTAGKGFSDPAFLNKYLTYFTFGIVGLAVISVAIFYNRLVKPIFVVPLNNPDDSVFSSVAFLRNPFLLSLTFIVILFIPLYLSASGGVFFSSIPQQVSEFGNVFGDSVLPGLNENLLMMTFIILVLSAGSFFFLNRLKSRSGFGLFKFLIFPLLMGGIWTVFHNLVYGSNEGALISTFVFGFVGGFLTVVFMSFYPWFILHVLSNFMVSIRDRGYFGNDVFILFLWFLWIVCVFLLLIFVFRKKKVK